MIEANLRNISSEMRFRHWHENPTELCEITLKAVGTFFFTAGSRLAPPWHRRVASAGSGRQLSRPLSRPPSRSFGLPPAWPPRPMVHYNLSISNT